MAMQISAETRLASDGLGFTRESAELKDGSHRREESVPHFAD